MGVLYPSEVLIDLGTMREPWIFDDKLFVPLEIPPCALTLLQEYKTIIKGWGSGQRLGANHSADPQLQVELQLQRVSNDHPKKCACLQKC